MNNLYASSSNKILHLPISKVVPRLDALLMVTKSCKGKTCVDPWSVIHPAGDVKTLGDALSPKYDLFYTNIAQSVSFNKCELGFILESEGPQNPAVFHADINYEEL
jgi:N-acetylglucosamine-6-sulfatase